MQFSQKAALDFASNMGIRKNEGESAQCYRSENSPSGAVDFAATMCTRNSDGQFFQRRRAWKEMSSQRRRPASTRHCTSHPTWPPMRCHAGLPPPQAKEKDGESSPRFPAQGVHGRVPLSIPLPPVLRDGSLGTGCGTGHPSRLGTTSRPWIA